MGNFTQSLFSGKIQTVLYSLVVFSCVSLTNLDSSRVDHTWKPILTSTYIYKLLITTNRVGVNFANTATWRVNMWSVKNIVTNFYGLTRVFSTEIQQKNMGYRDTSGYMKRVSCNKCRQKRSNCVHLTFFALVND